MTSEVKPQSEYDVTVAREEMKEQLHKQTEELSTVFQKSLSQILFNGAKSAFQPLIERACFVLDLLGYAPPKEMEKPPQEEFDEILKRTTSVIAEKASQSAKRSMDTSGDASIHSYYGVSGSLSGSIKHFK